MKNAADVLEDWLCPPLREVLTKLLGDELALQVAAEESGINLAVVMLNLFSHLVNQTIHMISVVLVQKRQHVSSEETFQQQEQKIGRSRNINYGDRFIETWIGIRLLQK